MVSSVLHVHSDNTPRRSGLPASHRVGRCRTRLCLNRPAGRGPAAPGYATQITDSISDDSPDTADRHSTCLFKTFNNTRPDTSCDRKRESSVNILKLKSYILLRNSGLTDSQKVQSSTRARPHQAAQRVEAWSDAAMPVHHASRLTLRTHGDTNKRKVLVGREPSLMIRRCIEIGLTSCRHLHVVTHIRGGAARINAAAAIVPDGISCHKAFSHISIASAISSAMSLPPHAHRAPRPVPAISYVQSLLGRPPPSTASLALVFAGERCWARRGSLDLARARCWIHC